MRSRGRGTLPPEFAGFVVDEAPEAAYLGLLRSGELARRVEAARAELLACRACPRRCGVDRWHAVQPAGGAGLVAGAAGSRPSGPRWLPGRPPSRIVPDHIPPGTACFTGRYARVSSAFPHFGEEDCLRGWKGSGTIFFSFCNLRCVFCQNRDISQAGEGEECRPEELAEMMLALQAAGCHNLDFVTPEHVVPQVLEAVCLAAEAGFRLPLVYNTSAYDSLAGLAWLDGVVDIFMPDFKYWEPGRARRYLKAEDYPEAARRAIREMHRQVGPLTVDGDGVAARGVLVRHLVMPGGLEDSRAIFRFLAREVSPDTYVNIMDQYRPAALVTPEKYGEICRRPAQAELETAQGLAEAEGLWRFDTRWRGRRRGGEA